MNLQRVQIWLSGALFVNCLNRLAEGQLLWALLDAIFSIVLVVFGLRNEK